MALPDFSRRSVEPEWLDAVELSSAELAGYLRDLGRFNRAMLGHWPIISWLKGALRRTGEKRVMTIMDIGCGNGELLRGIRRWSRRHALPLRLIGFDINAATIRIAQAATDAADDIEYRVQDIFSLAPLAPVDFVISSLLTHHLSSDLLVEFLRRIDAVGQTGWLIYDLQRHAVPYYAIMVIGRAVRLHPMVIQDGQISVNRSLTRSEWNEALAMAGICDAARVRWFLHRYLVSRLRPACALKGR